MDTLSIVKLCLASVTVGPARRFRAIATSIIPQQAGHPPLFKRLWDELFKPLPPPPPDPGVGAAIATYSANPDIYKRQSRSRDSFQNDFLCLGAEEAIAPYLTPRLQRAMAAGDWSSELSLAADQAIAQADVRRELEFRGVTL